MTAPAPHGSATRPLSPGTRTVAFGPVSIKFDETVLEPRPWTLAQSEWAAELLRTAPAGPLLELCAGAGQIGLAAASLSGRKAVLVDLSDSACRFATTNAQAAGLAEEVEVRHGAMDAAVQPEEEFALVLADPPYIPSDETSTYPQDPLTAIDGGADGLGLARLCLTVAARHVVPGGSVLLQLRDLEQAKRLAVELRTGPSSPLRYDDARMLGRGAVLHLRRPEA